MMNKRLLRTISFLVIFSIFFSFLNSIMEIPNLRWRVFYKLPKNSLDLLFIGNSHSFYTYEPLVIDKLLHTNSFNIGLGGENIVLSYYELREILKHQKPKVVVLETFSLDMTEFPITEPYYFEFFDAGMWDGSKLSVANRYLTPDTMYMVFPALRTRISWDDLSPYKQELINKTSDLFSLLPVNFGRRGATLNTRVIKEDDYQSILSQPPTEHRISPEVNRVYLEKFFELCEKNDIQLILTTSPMVGEPIHNERYAPFDVSGFAETHDIPYITYDMNNFTHLHFVNVDHVNEFGALIISLEMAEQLADIMEKDIDQARLSYYQDLIFTDYSLQNEKREVTISLLQADTDVPLEYQWSIRNRSIEKDIFTGDWSNDPIFHYRFPENGSYEITVKIRKSPDDFILTGLYTVGLWGPLGVDKSCSVLSHDTWRYN